MAVPTHWSRGDGWCPTAPRTSRCTSSRTGTCGGTRWEQLQVERLGWRLLRQVNSCLGPGCPSLAQLTVFVHALHHVACCCVYHAASPPACCCGTGSTGGPSRTLASTQHLSSLRVLPSTWLPEPRGCPSRFTLAQAVQLVCCGVQCVNLWSTIPSGLLIPDSGFGAGYPGHLGALR